MQCRPLSPIVRAYLAMTLPLALFLMRTLLPLTESASASAAADAEAFTSYADFSGPCAVGGRMPTGINVSAINEYGGELSLPSTFEDDFEGPGSTVAPDWNVHFYNGMGADAPIVANGEVTLSGSNPI